TTSSTNFPTTPGAFQTTFAGGTADAFVTELNSSGSALLYSTYLGGNGPVVLNEDDLGHGIAVDTFGNIYVTGWTRSSDFPITPGAFQTIFGGYIDAFVAKIGESCTIERIADLVASLVPLKLPATDTLKPVLDAALTTANRGDKTGAIRHLQEFIKV